MLVPGRMAEARRTKQEEYFYDLEEGESGET
jgi:hypothetical protein